MSTDAGKAARHAPQVKAALKSRGFSDAFLERNGALVEALAQPLSALKRNEVAAVLTWPTFVTSMRANLQGVTFSPPAMMTASLTKRLNQSIEELRRSVPIPGSPIRLMFRDIPDPAGVAKQLGKDLRLLRKIDPVQADAVAHFTRCILVYPRGPDTIESAQVHRLDQGVTRLPWPVEDTATSWEVPRLMVHENDHHASYSEFQEGDLAVPYAEFPEGVTSNLTDNPWPSSFLTESRAYLRDLIFRQKALAAVPPDVRARRRHQFSIAQDLRDIRQTLQALESEPAQALLTPVGKALVKTIGDELKRFQLARVLAIRDSFNA